MFPSSTIILTFVFGIQVIRVTELCMSCATRSYSKDLKLALVTFWQHRMSWLTPKKIVSWVCILPVATRVASTPSLQICPKHHHRNYSIAASVYLQRYSGCASLTTPSTASRSMPMYPRIRHHCRWILKLLHSSQRF
jgi:hypothetical protein